MILPKTKLIFGLLLLLLPYLEIQSKNITEDNTYPTSERLFHIARSANRNLVCYDINLDKGQLNTDDPIKVYWVNREENPGEMSSLNFVQRKFAYGYKVISSSPKSCVCTLNAYPKRTITVSHTEKGNKCLISINKQPAVLQSLYVKANHINPLKVEYVELHGYSIKSHQSLTERINN